MALPASGIISGSQIATAISTLSPYSLANMSILSGFTSSYKYSNFYNYVRPTIVTGSLLINLDASYSTSYPGSGSIWYDLSGNAANATLYNSPTFSQTDGQGSFSFNSIDQYDATVSDSTGKDTDSFTLTAWGKNNSGGPNVMAIRGNDGYGDGWSMLVGTDGTGHSQGYIVTTSAGAASYGSSGTISLSETAWRYIALTWDTGSGNLILYTNGAFDKIVASTTTRALRSSAIGELSNVNDTSYYGVSVGATAIYNRVLSASEILTNYNNTKAKYGL